MFPSGTSSSNIYKIAIGASAAQSTATQLYVVSQRANIIPFVVNTPASPTVDIAQFKVNNIRVPLNITIFEENMTLLDKEI